ncbi:MAG: hypothetical protein GXP11_01215, partial [Gammaproteobacteria bacterium]|nr:hypothetical protein [Gammaproteobacteria bacterium]
PIWNAEIMDAVCLYAVDNGIEENYTNQLIKKHAYVSVSSAIKKQNSAWQVRIFTFGEFVIEINGEIYKNKSKVKSKPLQLLKVLLSSESCSLSQSRVCELLWPDAEGDFAHQNMKTTLFRLRKILGSNNVLLVEGCLSLNQSTVWVDRWELDSHLANADKLDNAGNLCSLACGLYQGDFLTGEDAHWVLPVREKYKSKFVDC